MSRWYKDRSPPFGNKITIGEPLLIQKDNGDWINPETGEICQVISFDEIFTEVLENENSSCEEKN